MTGRTHHHRLYYDQNDYRLLEMVNRLLGRESNPVLLRKLFNPGLHPRGIKELAATKSLRMAAAMIDLLGTLEQGSPAERLAALRAVRAEILHHSNQALRFNVARVMLHIMKEIVRAGGDEARQLALAHDFRQVSAGNPRVIRRQLRAYHLLEMPEAWNQLAFDHHVHDANTKGRKSPTHLIMDAWIKGIRFLGVVYYNLVRPEAAAELLEAADIMGIEVRIGIELSARLRDRYVRLIWAPRGFMGRRDFLAFLEEPDVKAFFARGQQVVDSECAHVFRLLAHFNTHHLPRINQRFGIAVPPLEQGEFRTAVGCGQASIVHLAEFVHRAVLPHLRRRTAELSRGYPAADTEERARVEALLEAFNGFDPEWIVESCLRPEVNPGMPDPSVPGGEANPPEMLRLTPGQLFDRLERLPCRSRITLNPSNLSPAEVLEVLYAGRGRVTHLEIFNLKDWSQGRTRHREAINEMRLIINSGNVVAAKRMTRDILETLEADDHPGSTAAAEKIRVILWDLTSLLDAYRTRRLQSRLGSDSIGHSRHTRGMGLVVVPTLPWRSRREIRRERARRIPVATVAQRNTMQVFGRDPGVLSRLSPPQESHTAGPLPGMAGRVVTWSVGHNTTTLATDGNIATLGGRPPQSTNGLHLSPDAPARPHPRPRWGHLNTGVVNALKVAGGFLPAFLTFYLTKEWWLLAYCGAIIWFAITGLRNIVQSVVGGGGWSRSPLLNWRDLVSWSRVADSLLFTGFSVPLLDYLVKDLVLARGMGVTAAVQPFTLYSVMALANGIYLFSHNLFRGLPLGAAVGNLFRTVLSIPVAVGLSGLVLHAAIALGVAPPSAQAGLQLWAAIISKFASDLVAAMIEGAADRQHNLGHRRSDYGAKLAQVFDLYGHLAVAFPDQDVLALLERPKALAETLRATNAGLLHDMVAHALDLLYFWMYQPRAQTALIQQLAVMSPDEKRFLQLFQQILRRKRTVSAMLLNGLVGKRFERALAFYLSYTDRYLQVMERLAGGRPSDESSAVHRHAV
jgi:hypothetical protein